MQNKLMCPHLGFRVTVNAAGIFLFHGSRVSKHSHTQSEEIYVLYVLHLTLLSFYSFSDLCLFVVYSLSHTVAWERRSGELHLQTLSDWGQGLLWLPGDPEAEIKQRCLNMSTQTHSKFTAWSHWVKCRDHAKQNRKAQFLRWVIKQNGTKMINQ